MKKTIISIAVALVLIAGIALVILYNLGDRVIEEGIQEALEESLEQGTTLPDAAQADPNAGQTGTKGSNETQNQNTTANPAQKSDVQGNGSDGRSQQGGTIASKPAISREKMIEVKDKVSTIDKISAGTLILKRLSPSDLSELKGMLSNGVTSQEKQRAKQIVYQRFTPDEVNEIKAMYIKYMNAK